MAASIARTSESYTTFEKYKKKHDLFSRKTVDIAVHYMQDSFQTILLKKGISVKYWKNAIHH